MIVRASLLENDGISAAVVNARFAKPIDEKLLKELAGRTKLFITIEEGVLDGGFGSAVSELFEKMGIFDVKLRRVGLPSAFVEQGTREELFKKYGLTAEAVAQTVKGSLKWQR